MVSVDLYCNKTLPNAREWTLVCYGIKLVSNWFHVEFNHYMTYTVRQSSLRRLSLDSTGPKTKFNGVGKGNWIHKSVLV